MLCIWVHSAADDINHFEAVDGLAVKNTLQVNVIQVVLSVEHVHHATFNGLYHYHTSVEVGLFVHVPDNPVNKSAQEISFTKLNDAFGTLSLYGSLFVKSLHSILICLELFMACRQQCPARRSTQCKISEFLSNRHHVCLFFCVKIDGLRWRYCLISLPAIHLKRV